MIGIGAGDPTKAICSSLIAEAFREIGHPVLPFKDKFKSIALRHPTYCLPEKVKDFICDNLGSKTIHKFEQHKMSGNAVNKGFTIQSYDGKEEQYAIGALVGVNINERIGVFLEGKKLKYYGREEYNISTGINWRF